jgi:hypothetical protein
MQSINPKKTIEKIGPPKEHPEAARPTAKPRFFTEVTRKHGYS